jgi:hypothetical protein
VDAEPESDGAFSNPARPEQKDTFCGVLVKSDKHSTIAKGQGYSIMALSVSLISRRSPQGNQFTKESIPSECAPLNL